MDRSILVVQTRINYAIKLITHHDYKNSDKNSSKISEKGQGMLYVVQIPQVCLLNYILGIYYDVAHKHQKSKIQLERERESNQCHTTRARKAKAVY